MIYSENILICISAPLFVAVFFLRGRTRTFVVAFLAGMIVSLLSGYISGFINLVSGADLEETAIYVSPIIEEIMKLLPLLLGVLVLGIGEEDMLVTAVAIGTGFATLENCCCILQAGADSLLYTLTRGLAVGVMHVVCMMLLNLGLVSAKRLHAVSAVTTVGALSLSVVFHGLYNLLVSRPGVNAIIGYCLPLLAAGAYYVICVPMLMDRERAQEKNIA